MTQQTETGAPNAAQVEYWNTQVGATWVDLNPLLDRQLDSLGQAGIGALAPRRGERILDIGCGAGITTAQLAAAVAPTGSVTGVDISRPLLEVARARGGANAEFIEADAQTATFEPGAYDAIFSRFGVMFFADPAAAFANIRAALKPGGRLAFVCWRTPQESPLLTLGMNAAAPHLPPQPPADPLAPGPFAFADPARVRTILAIAGFTHIDLMPHDELTGVGDLETTMKVAMFVGPLGRLLRENPDYAPAAGEAVRKAMAERDGPEGIRLNGAVWIVTARAP